MDKFEKFWSLYPPASNPCSIEGCLNERSWKGMCKAHNHRDRRYGDPNGGPQRLSGELIRWLQSSWSTETSECQIWPFPHDGKGYGLFAMSGKLYRAHKFACEMINGEPPTNKHHAAHECGNSLCVNPCHLSWKTAYENMADKVKHGTSLKGEKHHQSKLTLSNVGEIRERAKAGESRKNLANLFGVKLSTIEDLIAGKTWMEKSMPDETFDKFWAAYPNKKGKGDALKAFKTAIKLASLEEMLKGIENYVANKPDWQAYKHPASWLRGQNWSDEWEPKQPRQNNRKRTLADALIDRNRDSFDAYGSWGEREPGYATLDLLGVRQRH